MDLRSLLCRLNPATSIEIVDNLAPEDREIVYSGALLNLIYCKVEELLDRNVDEIKMKIKEREYRVVIKVGYRIATGGGR